ncbi:MAG: helix-turn-helix domain-containing protein [Gammaproteobacteria bacterium]
MPIAQAVGGRVLGPVVAVAAGFEADDRVHPHWHDRAQLVYAESGAMTVRTDEGYWVVPPRRAVWVPAMKKHSFRMVTRVEMLTLYIEPALQPAQLDRCCVIQVSPLLHELVLRVLAFQERYDAHRREGRLVAVLIDEIEVAPTAPLHVPFPRDARLVKIARQIDAEPGDTRTLADWALNAGASERTLARRFVADTGMPFARWRQQVRLLKALQLLASGSPVTRVAADLGYESTSAFIAMFRKSLGSTPSRYFPARA